MQMNGSENTFSQYNSEHKDSERKGLHLKMELGV